MRTRWSLQGAFLFAWGMLWAVGGATAAGQPVADTAALDKMLYDALKEMHNRAADIYNAGDANGAYRMFQGGLLMTKPLLAHRPEVQQLIDQGMQNAERQASLAQRAHALHKTIEDVRARLKPPAPPPAASSDSPPIPPIPPGDPAGRGDPVPPPLPPPAGNDPPALNKTLWDRLGGETNVARVVDKLLTLTLEDPTINFARNGQYRIDKEKEADLKLKMIGYLSELSQGEVPYTGRSMAEVHQGMNIQGQEFDAFVKSLRLALDSNGVRAQDIEELMEKIQATRKDIVKD